MGGRRNFKPGAEWVEAAGGFDARREFDVNDPENWPHMAVWPHYMLHIYLRVIYLRVIENALVAQE